MKNEITSTVNRLIVQLPAAIAPPHWQMRATVSIREQAFLSCRFLHALVMVFATMSLVRHAAGDEQHLPLLVRELPAAAFSSAIHSETGDLFIADPIAGEIWRIPADWCDEPVTHPATLFASVPRPLAIVVKKFKDRDYLIAGCLEKSALRIFDLNTGKQTNASFFSSDDQISDPAVEWLSVSTEPSDPQIYFGIARYPRAYVTSMAKDVLHPYEAGPEGRHFNRVVINPEGNRLYGYESKSHELHCWQINPQPPVRGKHIGNRTLTDSMASALIVAPSGQGIAYPSEVSAGGGRRIQINPISSDVGRWISGCPRWICKSRTAFRIDA